MFLVNDCLVPRLDLKQTKLTPLFKYVGNIDHNKIITLISISKTMQLCQMCGKYLHNCLCFRLLSSSSSETALICVNAMNVSNYTYQVDTIKSADTNSGHALQTLERNNH